MCWQQEDELYNDGQPFKIVCRDMRGVIVTVIADNYFGYSKKEIKSQISYSANLFGGCEEEHSGGALAFPCFNLGERYQHQGEAPVSDRNFATLCEQLAPWIAVQASGFFVPFMLIIMSAALLSNVVQVGFNLSGYPLLPRIEKLNPMAGFRRMFSARSLAELTKSIFKIVLVGAIAFVTVRGEFDRLVAGGHHLFAAGKAVGITRPEPAAPHAGIHGKAGVQMGVAEERPRGVLALGIR